MFNGLTLIEILNRQSNMFNHRHHSTALDINNKAFIQRRVRQRQEEISKGLSNRITDSLPLDFLITIFGLSFIFSICK